MVSTATLLLVIFAMSVIAIAAFYLGYQAAETKERQAKKDLQRQAREVRNQMSKLSRWVRENWPNEYAAYRNGHIEGYQQGVYQASELEHSGEG